MQTEKMNIKFAFAVNSFNQFQKKHFGDADKYLIYESNGSDLQLIEEVENPFKDDEFEKVHGSAKKGKSIIQFLKDKGVIVLVSKQFGQNLKLVNKHFIPIIIFEDEPDDVLDVISRHWHWIHDELTAEKDNYSLFTIKSGVLKSKI